MTQLIQRLVSRSLATRKNSDPLTRINSILSKYHPFEPKLDRVRHLVNPKILSSVFLHPPDLQSGIRFFIWAFKYRSLRAWEINDLVIDVLLKQTDGFDLYWKTLEELRQCGFSITSDAFTVLISGYYKAGKAEKAVESFGKMSDFNCKPNVLTYNALLYVMVQQNVLLLALAVYTQMLKFNCSPNVATYSILIDGLCKNGMLEDALALFDEMTERSVLPNTITYTIVLLGLCHAKRPYEAKELLNKMTSERCRPDTITWDGLLAGFCKLGKVDEAFLLLRSFENQGYVLGLRGYSCLIDGLFKVGRFEEAKKWYRKLLEENIRPDVVLYTIMIQGLSEAGRVKDAWELFQEMTAKGVTPDTQCYNMLIKGFCDAGLLEEAESLKLEISKNDCFPDTNTHTILICGMCRNGMVGEAKHIFEEMEKLGCLPSAITFNALIDGLCKVGQFEEARFFFYKMEIGRNPSVFLRLSQGANRVLDKASLQTLIAQLCDSGLYLKAYRLLSKLADTGVLPTLVTYNILINGMCKSGDLDGAFKIFKEIQLKGESPDTVTYGTLINWLCKANRDEEAMGMFEGMIKNGISPSSSVYKTLMTWLCRRGKVTLSFSLWLNYLRRLENRDASAIRLIEEHFEKGEVEEAVRSLLKMDSKMKEVNLAPYTIWLIGLCQARRVDEALKIFHVLQEFELTITPPSCAKLIEACLSEQKLDLAASVFLYALDKGFFLSRQNCNELLYAMFRSETYVNYAIRLLSKMDAMGFNLDTHLGEKTKSLWRYHIMMQQSVQ